MLAVTVAALTAGRFGDTISILISCQPVLMIMPISSPVVKHAVCLDKLFGCYYWLYPACDTDIKSNQVVLLLATDAFRLVVSGWALMPMLLKVSRFGYMA